MCFGLDHLPEDLFDIRGLVVLEAAFGSMNTTALIETLVSIVRDWVAYREIEGIWKWW